MAELEIELESDLIEQVKHLAVRHYGDSGDTSMSRVAESALKMRLLWLILVKEGGNEIEEPICRLKEDAPTPLWNGFWNDILRR